MSHSDMYSLATSITKSLPANAVVFPVAKAPCSDMLRKFLFNNYIVSIDINKSIAIVEPRNIDPVGTQSIAENACGLLLTLANPMAKLALHGVKKLYVVNEDIKVYGDTSIGIPASVWLLNLVTYTFDAKNVRTHLDVIHGNGSDLINVRLADAINRFELVTQDRVITLQSNIVTSHKASSYERIIAALEEVIETAAKLNAPSMAVYDFGCILSPNVHQYTPEEVIKYVTLMLRTKEHYQDNADRSEDILFKKLLSAIGGHVASHHKELEVAIAATESNPQAELRKLIDDCNKRNEAKLEREAKKEVLGDDRDFDIATVCINYLIAVGGDLNINSGEISFSIYDLKPHAVLSVATKQDPLLYASLLNVFEPSDITKEVNDNPKYFTHLTVHESNSVHPIEINKTIALLKNVISQM